MALRVDFSELEQAVQRMGAQPVEFDVHFQSTPLDSIDIELERGIELPDLREVETTTGLLSYQGRQILLYIQDHGNKAKDTLADGKKGNKFHVADCRTLKDMRARGRYERYVVTNRLDGEFFITGQDWRTKENVEGDARLWVCRNCLKTLNYKGARRGDNYEIAKTFEIGKFFSTYSSFFSYLPQRRAGSAEEDGYTADWTQIAAHYKADKDFVCESCGVDLTTHKNLLHVHHRNGVKGDNRHSNLMALCVSCHREQPSHGHMFVRHQDTKTISRLRRDQGLLGGSDWKKVAEYCDPALHGVLDAFKQEGAPMPEISLDVQDNKQTVVANLEIGWPKCKVGISISDDDHDRATTVGWRVWRMMEALESTSRLLDDLRRRGC